MRWRRKEGERFPCFQRDNMGRDAPLLLALKMIMSGCDGWSCGSHFGAMRRAHVEPSLQLKVGE